MEKDRKNDALIHSFTSPSSSAFLTPQVIVIFLGVLVLGVMTGYLLSRSSSAGGSGGGGLLSQPAKTVGVDDPETFSDTTDGILREGGIDGEGAYHLERGSGPEQYAYLTSSIVDLSQYVGKKVKVWGKTEQAKKAPWLMDVGKLQVL